MPGRAQGSTANQAGAGRDADTTVADGATALLGALARPWVAFAAALVVYLLRAAWGTGLARSEDAYFNYLADAFLHGQTHLRLTPPHTLDLVYFADRTYLYWPPFPAVLVAPLVALFGVDVSDRLYTAVVAALAIGLLARLLAALDAVGIAPLDAARRGVLVAGIAFGSFVLILAPAGNVWSTAQLVGWACTILAALAAVAVPGARGYLLAGLALAAAMATRNSLVLNGLWLAYHLLRRDRRLPLRALAGRALLGIAPVAAALALLAAYNVARFGDPRQLGLPWHNMHPIFRADYERYGLFDLHYLPTNLYYQFLAYSLFTEARWQGSGIFWMSPLLLAAPYALWRGRQEPLTWALALTCALVYAPIGLLMGTGYFQFGPRYLLDLMVPLVVLAARGLRPWPRWLLALLLAIGVATYAAGSWLWWATLGI